MYFEGAKMKDAVSHLRAVWYEKEHLFTYLGRPPDRRDCVDKDDNHPLKKGADCQKLWLAMIKKANEDFRQHVPWVEWNHWCA